MYKIMIVDDESKTRQTLHRYVPWNDIGVLVAGQAEDGMEALEIAREILPDIVLTDVRMPRMNGIDFAKQLRVVHPNCKIIFLSAYTDKDYLKFAIKLHAVDYLEKPLNLEEVQRSVRLAVSVCDEERGQIALERKLKEQETEHLIWTKQRLVSALCSSGGDRDLEKKLSMLQTEGVGLPLSGSYVCVVFRYQYAEDNAGDIALYQNEYVQALEKRLTDLGCSFLFGILKPNHWIAHLCYPDQLTIKPLTEAIHTFVEACKKAEINVFASIGGSFTDIFSLSTSYEQAAALIHRSFYLGTNHTVLHEYRYLPAYPIDPLLPEQLIRFLKEKQYAAAEELIRNFAKDLRHNPDTPIDQTKDAFFAAFLRLNQWMEQENLMLSKSGNGRNNRFLYAQLFNPLSTLTEYEDILIQAIRTFSVYMEQQNKLESIASKIMNIIHEQACDPNLSVNAIARLLFLTPSYICLVFKNETDMTINHYMISIRMEKAKNFIANRKIKLYEIAEMIGYTDARYFAGLFKKEVGCTPSEYRERLRP